MRVSMKAIAMLAALVCTSAVHAEMVVVVNPKNSATSMTAEQVANIYLGKDTSFAPVDLAESNAARNRFYEKVVGKDAAQVKAIWARLIFTGKTQPPKEVGSSADAIKEVAANDKGVAYVEKSAVDASVKTVLTIN